MVMLRKIGLFLILAAIGLMWLRVLPKERTERFVIGMIVFYVIGFAWRVGSWLLTRI